MLNRLIAPITNFICWLRKKRIVKPQTGIVKINVGSGLSVVCGWINVDISLNAFFSKWPKFVLKVCYKISGCKQWCSEEEYCRILRNHIFVHHDVKYGLPFPDNSVDYLYSSHFLEHLFKEEARQFLKEAHRVLKKEGIIRIGVPDLEYAISLYQKGEREKALQYFFSSSSSNFFSRHQYMYDFDLLSSFLKEAGFTKIERCLYRQGKMPDIEQLDTRDNDTLYIEAIK